MEPVEPSTCKRAPCQANKPARVTTKEGTAKRLKRLAWRTPIASPTTIGGAVARWGGHAPADGTHREVDLPQQQHVDDAHRDQPDGGDLQHQVGQVLGREEAVVLELEDRPDQSQADDHAQRGEIALDQAPDRLLRPGQALLGLGGAGSRFAHRSSSPLSALSARSSCSTPFFFSPSEPTPVIAETTCSSVVDSAANSPAARPSRRTKIRSATSKTSTRLWLITTTPSSRSRRRRIRFRTCAVWATPSAAVGSSRSTTFGSPSSERATATCWR